jgi:hypothetical protein
VILGVSGRLYLDKEGPYDLRQILLEMGVDFTSVGPDDFRANAISENGLAIVGSVVVNGVTKAWRLKLTDCDGNGAADELERLAVGGDASRLISEGSEKFAASRETLGYGDMISQYGRPWKYGEDRVPARDLEQPAEFPPRFAAARRLRRRRRGLHGGIRGPIPHRRGLSRRSRSCRISSCFLATKPCRTPSIPRSGSTASPPTT